MTSVDERNPNDRPELPSEAQRSGSVRPAVASAENQTKAANESDQSRNLDPWTVSQKQPVPMVAISNLWVKYGSVQAVRGITFTIPRGEVFGFIGPNGAGKSSTIRVLATLQTPTAGWAMIDGIEVRKDPKAIRRKIGYMPDYFGLYEDLTVREYLHFFAAAYDLPEGNRDRLVDDVLTLTDLSQKIDTLVDHLSRGMKQRLGLARVLLHDPDLLLLDEPASGLDPRARIEVREILKELSGMGKTILISSHILHELSHLCTRIGILEAGKLMTEGSLQEIYARLGLMQIVHAQVVSAPPDLATSLARINGVEAVDLRADRLSIRIRAETLPPEDLLDQIRNLGARVRMFQPEAMELETAFLKLTEGKTA